MPCPPRLIVQRVLDRHVEINRMVAVGYPISEIARRLGLDRKTVRHYRDSDLDTLLASARDRRSVPLDRFKPFLQAVREQVLLEAVAVPVPQCHGAAPSGECGRIPPCLLADVIGEQACGAVPHNLLGQIAQQPPGTLTPPRHDALLIDDGRGRVGRPGQGVRLRLLTARGGTSLHRRSSRPSGTCTAGTLLTSMILGDTEHQPGAVTRALPQALPQDARGARSPPARRACGCGL